MTQISLSRRLRQTPFSQGVEANGVRRAAMVPRRWRLWWRFVGQRTPPQCA